MIEYTTLNDLHQIFPFPVIPPDYRAGSGHGGDDDSGGGSSVDSGSIGDSCGGGQGGTSCGDGHHGSSILDIGVWASCFVIFVVGTDANVNGNITGAVSATGTPNAFVVSVGHDDAKANADMWCQKQRQWWWYFPTNVHWWCHGRCPM